jgi:hypothetical protein
MESQPSKKRVKSLTELSIVSNFSSLDQNEKVSVVRELILATYGITKSTLEYIDDQTLKKFATYVINIIAPESIQHYMQMTNLKEFYHRYCKFKEEITGGYWYDHYEAGGLCVYLFTAHSGNGGLRWLKTNEFVYGRDSINVDEWERITCTKEEFFSSIEWANFIPNTVVTGKDTQICRATIITVKNCIPLQTVLQAIATNQKYTLEC